MGLFYCGAIVLLGISGFACVALTVTGIVGLVTSGINSSGFPLIDLVAACFAASLCVLLWGGTFNANGGGPPIPGMNAEACRGEIIPAVEVTDCVLSPKVARLAG